MALSQTQKQWAIGGGIGAIVLVVGYRLFKRIEDARSRPVALQIQTHARRGHPRRDRGENGRGEYGRSKRHHHKRHGHG